MMTGGRREKRDAFHRPQNREERPAARNGAARGLLFGLERGKKRTTFLADETRSRRTDRRAACARHARPSLFPSFGLTYAPIYLLSLASRGARRADVEESEIRELIGLISTNRQSGEFLHFPMYSYLDFIRILDFSRVLSNKRRSRIS